MFMVFHHCRVQVVSASVEFRGSSLVRMPLETTSRVEETTTVPICDMLFHIMDISSWFRDSAAWTTVQDVNELITVAGASGGVGQLVTAKLIEVPSPQPPSTPR